MVKISTSTRKCTAAFAGLLLFLPGVQADQDSRALGVTCDARHTIGKSLRHVRPGDTVVVSGTCNENVEIPAELQRITLDGRGTATVNGTDATRPVFGIKGKDIVVRGFTVTGGRDGIEIDAGGSAVLDGNVIQQTGRDGIQVKMNSSAVIVNNTVQDNPRNGMHVTETSSARIGFHEDLGTAGPNIIQRNADRGIRVTRSSSARIYGNTISNNGNHGIDVRRAAYADISSNDIDGNASDGILVNQNSAIVLGADVTEDPLADDPNRTTVNNARVGIRCGTNSSADGRRGTLTGNSGPTSFDATCVNSTIP